MREQYSEAGLDEADVADDPIVQFGRWFEEWLEAKPYDANAVIVATTDADGWPSARAVLLKGLDERGFVFHTNRRSDKGLDLDRSRRAALCFLWHPVERQVRVAGTVEHLPDDESDAYFASRPRGAQIAATASPQSRVIADRAELERLTAETEARFAGATEVPRPPALGRLSGAAPDGGVLAGPPQPHARPAALPPLRHRARCELGDRAPRPLKSQPGAVGADRATARSRTRPRRPGRR